MLKKKSVPEVPLSFDYTGFSQMAYASTCHISQEDIDQLEKSKFVFKTNYGSYFGYIIHIGPNNKKTEECWAPYSAQFFQLIKYCEQLGCEWLRIH
jgi:hypothetical protein